MTGNKPMQSILRAASLAALLAVPAYAQDSTDGASQTAPETTTQSTTEATPEAEAAPQGDIEGTPTAPQSAEGVKAGETIVAVHKDWQIRCLPENRNCYMYQLAIDAREAPVAEMSVVALPEGGDVVAGFTVMTPLRTYLPAGVQVQIDNGRLQRYQFEFCAEQGCIARFGVSETGLNQFRAGNKVRITVISAENREAPVVLDVSLLGFTAGMKELAGL